MNIEESIIEFKKMIERDKDTLRYWKSDTFGHYDEPIKKLEKDVLISETLLTAYEKEKEKNNNVLGLIFEYGQTDGEHHKAWVIDQIVRIITENNYDKWVQHYEYDEETDEDYFWDIGIAP